MITAKIDVAKIDKKRLFSGKNGTYLDFLLIETSNDTYGNDFMIVESVTKDEREKGIKGRILGNAKIVIKHEASPEVKSIAVSNADEAWEQREANESDDLPF
jgi:hypothetical protein